MSSISELVRADEESQDTRAAALKAARIKERALTKAITEVMTSNNSRAFTSDDLATLLNKPLLTVRPAVTRMVKAGLLIDSGMRGFTAYGKKAKAYSLKAA